MRQTLAHSRLPRASAVVVSLLSLIAPVTGWTQTAPATASFDYDAYVQYVRDKGLPPCDYIISKLKTHNLVMIGEDHWLKDHPAFIAELIRAIAEDPSVKLDYLAIEFGSALDQALADELIDSPKYREDLVIRILQRGPDFCGWPYEEVLDILKTLWQENKSHPERKPIRLLLLDNPYVDRLQDGEKSGLLLEEQDLGFHLDRDRYQAFILEKQVLATNSRAIFYGGSGHTEHTLTPSASEKNPGFCYLSPSAGQILATSYPTKVFSVRLWGADTWPNYYPSTNPDSWDRLYGGRIDEVFHRNGDKPAGFDVNAPPFSQISIGELFQVSPDYYSKENPGCPPEYLSTTINQVVDGLVFLKPLAGYQGGAVSPKCFDDQFMKKITARMGGEVRIRKDLYKYLLDTRPILGRSLESLIKAESER